MRALDRFDPGDVATVAGWVTSLDEARAWASTDAVPDASTFARWHADPDVHPFVVRADDGRLVAYGEVWEDAEEDEAELARLLVAPDARGQGIGRWLARGLADEAHRRGFSDVWLRVVPENTAAMRAYAAAGFLPATVDQEAAFNIGQPVAYRWMRDAAWIGPDVTGPQPLDAYNRAAEP